MDQSKLDELLDKWKPLIEQLDQPLAAYGNRTVDINQPDWWEKMMSEPTPFDSDPALHELFQGVSYEVAGTYLQCTPDQAAQVQRLPFP